MVSVNLRLAKTWSFGRKGESGQFPGVAALPQVDSLREGLLQAMAVVRAAVDLLRGYSAAPIAD